jgi:hypothetical protein
MPEKEGVTVSTLSATARDLGKQSWACQGIQRYVEYTIIEKRSWAGAHQVGVTLNFVSNLINGLVGLAAPLLDAGELGKTQVGLGAARRIEVELEPVGLATGGAEQHECHCCSKPTCG